jgi:hypothetical protein
LEKINARTKGKIDSGIEDKKYVRVNDHPRNLMVCLWRQQGNR